MVNPARAGMIPRVTNYYDYPWGKPRASGDDPDEDFKAAGDIL